MHIARKAVQFLLSLGTTIWLVLALLVILFCGSFIMPANPEFQALSTMPLFAWLTETSFALTWWLWGAVAILSLLTANTLFCSIESIIKKRGGRNWLLIISPQIIHIGFLFILLAHLLSSYGSFKGTTVVSPGTSLQLPNGLTVLFRDIRPVIDPSGYVKDWSGEVEYFREGSPIAKDVIAPNSPSFQDGLGIYIKTVQEYPVAALIEVSREPGAAWALAGGILFLAGMVSLLALKIQREEAHDNQ